MGLYANHIFPRLMDRVMRTPSFQKQRQEVLAQVYGNVLEIGFGTGLNLPHYPNTVTWLTAIEPGYLLSKRVAERTANLAMPLEIFRYRAETLPWEDQRFDCAVSTWTLCTIRDPLRALSEIRRVLKPGGKFIFLEHGRSDDPKVARWQNILNPFQRLFACGCHLNRRIARVIEDSGFTVEQLDRFVMEGIPRPGADMYRGVARPKQGSFQNTDG
jgi:ubiquinone/menaquinone biosynthesis C-methylase UbiE